MDLVTSSRGESLPVGQASEIQLRIQVGSLYPHTIVHTVYDSTKRCEAQQAERPSASPARDVEHSAGATASRLPLFAHPHPTALQLHAATAHTDVERPLLSARCWHGPAMMTGANGKLFAAADIKRSDLVPDKLRCSRWPASGLVSDYRGHGPAVGRTAATSIRTAPASTGGMATQSGVAHGKPTSCDEPTHTNTHTHTHTHTHAHAMRARSPAARPWHARRVEMRVSCPC